MYLENESTEHVLHNHSYILNYFLNSFQKSCKLVGVHMVENNTVLRW